MNIKYLITNTHSIPDMGKVGSSSLSSAILQQLHPDKIAVTVGYDPANTPNHFGRDRIPREDTPSLPVLMPVREPVERFRSACSQSRIEDVDALLDKLENDGVLRGDNKAIESFHFRPQTDYLPLDQDIKLYQFPAHFDDLGTAAGLTVPMPVVNDSESNNPPKPDLTPTQQSRVEAIYADDIALYNLITSAGTDYHTPVITPPDPEPEPVYIPRSVDSWKLKAVLEIAGKTPTIEAVIDGIEDDTQRIAIRAGWDNAPVIARDNQFVQTMIAIPALDITTEQMDQFFLATKQFD